MARFLCIITCIWLVITHVTFAFSQSEQGWLNVCVRMLLPALVAVVGIALSTIVTSRMWRAYFLLATVVTLAFSRFSVAMFQMDAAVPSIADVSVLFAMSIAVGGAVGLLAVPVGWVMSKDNDD